MNVSQNQYIIQPRHQAKTKTSVQESCKIECKICIIRYIIVTLTHNVNRKTAAKLRHVEEIQDKEAERFAKPKKREPQSFVSANIPADLF